MSDPHVVVWVGTSLLLTSLLACGGGGSTAAAPTPAPAPAPTPGLAPAPAPTPTVRTLRSDLQSPWALARLPGGDWLLTEKAGRLWRLSADARSKAALSGLPAVDASGQGGLLDVAVDPDFAAGENWIYFSYAEPGAGGAGTAVARARLGATGLSELAVIFRQQPKVGGSGHYGSRLVFGRDKTLFITLGERQLGSPAQDLRQTLGKVVRIRRDGSLPPDNPVWPGTALPGIWSLGHRNPQGAALHPQTGALWVSEHGPQGGDEINIARAGANYGWPLRSYGCNYGDPPGPACQLGGGAHAPQFVEPLSFWVPISVAPSNIVFVDGPMFPEWRGDLLMGALAGQAIWRLRYQGERELLRERIFEGERVRDVDLAPDGSIWFLTDSGRLLQLVR
ncbi:MAG: PQQ-dependent sugar dehydrogenase [Inhella sp.]